MAAAENATGGQLVDVPGVATFGVTAGSSVEVYLAPGADRVEVQASLDGRVSAALLQQRGLLPLHLATVVVGDRAVGFAGPPGAGKSSLAAAMTDRGHRLLTDDLAALTWLPDGRAAVPPGPPYLRVWGSTARELGWPADDRHRICAGVDKYRYDLPERLAAAPAPLGTVYVLLPAAGTQPELRELTGFGKFEAYYAGATYHRELIDATEARTWHFAEVCRLARRVPAFTLRAPADTALDGLAELVEQHCLALGAGG